MRLTQLTEGPCDVAKPEEIEKMSGTEYDKYAQWKKDCEADERTTPLSTKRMSEKAKPDFLDLDKDGDKKEPMKSAGKQKKEVCEEPQVESYSDDYDLDSNWEDDYHGDMSQEEYDQEVDNSQMEYAVWVGGTEVNDKWLTYDEAITLYDKYKAQGYDDIKLDARIKESVTETDEEQLDEFLPALGVAAAAAAVGTGAYKVGKKIGNWASSKKTATADTLPGDGMVKKAGADLQNRKTQMSKNLAALKSESAFSKKVKEAADEDAEAVSARDDFVNMMSSKPKSSNKAIDTIKKIVADKQNQQVKFDDGKMKVDLYTASAISQVYDAVKPETQEKIDNMLRTKEGMLKMSNFAFSKLSEGLKEGKRLDEILPAFLPYAIAGARVLGPLVKKHLLKYGAKKAAQNLSKIATKLPPGAKYKTAGDIYKKARFKRTAAAVGALDYGLGDGNVVSNVLDVPSRIKNGITSIPNTPFSTNNKVTPNHRSTSNNNGFNWVEDEQVDGKVINEIQPEYVGADAIVDQNGKKHNPNSPKAKMIINMRKKNSGNKDSEEMTPKEIKAAKLAKLKMMARGEQQRAKTTSGIKKGFKKGIKGLGNIASQTGFNPLAASKYSPEDMAMEMVEKAMDQALLEDK